VGVIGETYLLALTNILGRETEWVATVVKVEEATLVGFLAGVDGRRFLEVGFRDF
jgi:hypothetical protein